MNMSELFYNLIDYVRKRRLKQLIQRLEKPCSIDVTLPTLREKYSRNMITYRAHMPEYP